MIALQYVHVVTLPSCKEDVPRNLLSTLSFDCVAIPTSTTVDYCCWPRILHSSLMPYAVRGSFTSIQCMTQVELPAFQPRCVLPLLQVGHVRVSPHLLRVHQRFQVIKKALFSEGD